QNAFPPSCCSVLVGLSVSFSCGGIQECSRSYSYRFWYQKKETETFKIILYFDESNGYIYKGYGHPQKDDFTAEKTQSGSHSFLEHTFSLCLGYGYGIFGSGTGLFVTGKKNHFCSFSCLIVENVSSLLCLASAMFPPVVQFSWKRQKNNGPLEDLTSEEPLDLRESGYSASILLLHQQEDSSYKYICSVKHEGGTVEAQTQQGDEGLVTVFNRDSASC
uniref:Ig-like domain-containing protein n=1 Tax=Oryzias latipes TaxID=8090 RepID=A0A3P9MJK8_ORYLA